MMHSTLVTLALFAGAPLPHDHTPLNPALETYVAARVAEFDQIPDDRKQELARIAQYVRSQSQAGRPARLTFICTHNSRRSHLSQVWAQTAAAH